MHDSHGAAPASRSGRPGQHQSTPRRREEILEAASAAFAAKGFANATLAEIASAAGISAPTIIHHFGTKEGLLTELLAERDRSINQIPGKTDVSGLDYLEHLVDTVALNMSRPGITQLYAVLSADSVTEGHPAQSFFRDRYLGLRAKIAEAVRASLPAAIDVDPRAVQEVAASITAVMDGLQVQWLLSPQAVDMATAAKRTIRALVEDLRQDPAGADPDRWLSP